MRILIGTPIHQVKDYCLERWLENVGKLQLQYPADLLMVDNSPGLEYVEKVKDSCKKYGIKNYKIRHVEIDQEQGANERIGRCREIIRQHLLSRDYDAWFSWECDEIIPTNTLRKLVALIGAGNYMMVCLGSPGRKLPQETIAAFGVTLIKRDPLEKYGFFMESPDMPNTRQPGENWLKKQILQDGGNYIEVFGKINPIYHVNE